MAIELKKEFSSSFRVSFRPTLLHSLAKLADAECYEAADILLTHFRDVRVPSLGIVPLHRGSR
ncbi:MAG: hypothetical protein LZ166_05830, partial [Thaumarchaeota archaeon]|nr:hypothetical protein [Candidatus Wolframiiraptor allenii]